MENSIRTHIQRDYIYIVRRHNNNREIKMNGSNIRHTFTINHSSIINIKLIVYKHCNIV